MIVLLVWKGMVKMNKIVIVTGATNGYGLATAQKFQKEGDTVIIVSRNREKVEATVEKYGFSDGFTLDVTDYSGWLELKKYVLEKYHRVDVLVNNAGGGVKIDKLISHDKESIDKVIALNLNSVIYGSRIFADILTEQKSGIIINISSVCARHCWQEWTVYAAAKAGVLNFTKGLYTELQQHGARATCIIPAAAGTDFQKNSGIADVDVSLKTEDIANAVYFAANQPETVVVEEMTVWGTSQVVEPL